MSRDKSHALFQRAQELMPGGVNSPARAFGGVGGEPIVFERGDGAYLFDVDGNRYIDYVGSWGPMILGHRHPAVVAALEEALARGTSFGAPTEAENTLAELVIDMVPSVEMVRLVNSGTEATMSAIRLARGFTKRDKIIKFSGCYHGHADCLLVAAGSAAATLGVPNSPGVTEGVAKDTVVLPFNDSVAFEQMMADHGSEIACVIVEPVAGNMGCVPGSEEFLSTLRRVTEQHGTVLIFDEVMCGFRVAAGGAQQVYGITPDLTTLGKVIGGGLPVGAYGGKAEIMKHVLPAGPVMQAGTLSGNPLATAAGIATLQILKDENPYPGLQAKAKRLGEGLLEAATSNGVKATVQGRGAMLTLFFHDGPVNSWDDAAECDTKAFGRYFWGLAERGVYMPCSQYEALFISAAHTEQDIDDTIAAAKEVLAK